MEGLSPGDRHDHAPRPDPRGLRGGRSIEQCNERADAVMRDVVQGRRAGGPLLERGRSVEESELCADLSPGRCQLHVHGRDDRGAQLGEKCFL